MYGVPKTIQLIGVLDRILFLYAVKAESVIASLPAEVADVQRHLRESVCCGTVQSSWPGRDLRRSRRNRAAPEGVVDADLKWGMSAMRLAPTQLRLWFCLNFGVTPRCLRGVVAEGPAGLPAIRRLFTDTALGGVGVGHIHDADVRCLTAALKLTNSVRRPGSEHGWGHIPDSAYTSKDGGPVELLEFKTCNCASGKWAAKAANFDELFTAVQAFWAKQNGYTPAAEKRLTWLMSSFLGAQSKSLQTFLTKRLIPSFESAPEIYCDWKESRDINGRRGTHLAYTALRRFWLRRFGMTHVRALTYVFFVRAQRAACRAKGVPLDDWRNALDDRHSSFAPEMTHFVRQLGVHAVAGMPKGMTEIHI